MEDKTLIIVVALVILAAIEITALILGYNGTLLAGVIGILGLVVGVPAGIKYKETHA